MGSFSSWARTVLRAAAEKQLGKVEVRKWRERRRIKGMMDAAIARQEGKEGPADAPQGAAIPVDPITTPDLFEALTGRRPVAGEQQTE
jgi:hypothetical protein